MKFLIEEFDIDPNVKNASGLTFHDEYISIGYNANTYNNAMRVWKEKHNK